MRYIFRVALKTTKNIVLPLSFSLGKDEDSGRKAQNGPINLRSTLGKQKDGNID